MKDTEKEIRDIARKLLQDGTVPLVIGYESGSLPLMMRAAFIRRPQDCDRLVWNSSCKANLAGYLKNIKGKVALVVKGCDSLAIANLIREHQVKREEVYLIGIPCDGIIDRKRIIAGTGREPDTGEISGDTITVTTHGSSRTWKKSDLLLEYCTNCMHQTPEVFDVMAGEAITPKTDGLWKRLEEFEAMSRDERWEYFSKQVAKCQRCYACRNVCPLCYCKACFAENTKPRDIDGSVEESDVQLFHLLRAFHTAGRCIGCGECIRVCPMGVDLSIITRKTASDCAKLFGGDVTADAGKKNTLDAYKEDDWQEFFY